jgi:cell division protease FtsH
MNKEIAIGAIVAVCVFGMSISSDPLPWIVIFSLGVLFFLLFNRNQPLKWSQPKALDSIPNVSFDEIGGQTKAKEELKEAIDFLIHRKQIAKYGIRPIKGILLSGPPGTGKTLMAKAAAHYTQSVFVSASGSEFVEKYVGIGAQRIRDLFQNARKLAKQKKASSAIVFIDEIDVIGGKREGAQHKEYDQTLNQLLTEMDGIHTDQDIMVLVIAATNRKDMLDSALLRPGRFDRHIIVDLPNKKAREQILELHTQNKPLAPDVDLEQIAKETFGFSGAQLESLTNEAAIYAMRERKERIEQSHFAAAIDKVMMGEKTDRETTFEEKERTAIHELGHAIVAELVRPGSVSQVALSARGQALGYVRHYPEHDRYLYVRKQLEEQIMICLAGAAAEELLLGNRSTGAMGDYEQAHQYVKTLIESGLSELGIIHPELEDKEKIYQETKNILEQLYQRTASCLMEHQATFNQALKTLLREEILTGEEFRKLLPTPVTPQVI